MGVEVEIEVLYTCHVCGIEKRAVPVIERAFGEDILVWVGKVQMAVGLDHRRTSPECRSMECDLMIPYQPLEGGEIQVGQARRQ